MAGEKDLRTQMDDFTLGRPALVCRWRLANRTLPLENRHLRALGQRLVDGHTLSPQLVSWAKQHIEWTLADGAAEHPDGVLMLIVDHEGRAAMTVGPYEALRSTGVASLAQRAQMSSREADKTWVSPESLWLVRGEQLVWGMAPGEKPSGAGSLMSDLAKTIGIPVERRQGLAARVLREEESFDEAFLVSDEHGIVCASNASGPRSERFAAGYAKLLEKAR